jgi:hypothetical protein
MKNQEKTVSVTSIVAAVAIIAFLAMSAAGYNMWRRLQDAQATIEDQAGALSGSKSDLQKMNQQLGLAETTVVSRDKVIKDYAATMKDLKKELDGLKGAKRIAPISKDKIIVVVEKRVDGGTQTVKEEAGIVAYNWADPTGRFSLADPDIRTSGDESFKYLLKVKVTGFVLQDKTGAFQARQVVAQEVYTVDGKEVVGPALPLESNIYEYAPKLKESSIFDIWHPRLYVALDTQLTPNIGVELLNAGRYWDYANVGLGTFIATDLAKLPNSVLDSRLGVSLQYTFIPPLLSSNIAVGLGISTPFNSFLQDYEVTGSLIFFFTN